MSTDEEMKRLRLLDNCRCRTSASTISILENLKSRIRSFREQKMMQDTRNLKTQEDLATLVAHSKTSNNEITNNLKIYHRHISKLNKHIDKVMGEKTEESGIISLVLPPYDRRLTSSAMNRILHMSRNKSR